MGFGSFFSSNKASDTTAATDAPVVDTTATDPASTSPATDQADSSQEISQAFSDSLSTADETSADSISAPAQSQAQPFTDIAGGSNGGYSGVSSVINDSDDANALEKNDDDLILPVTVSDDSITTATVNGDAETKPVIDEGTSLLDQTLAEMKDEPSLESESRDVMNDEVSTPAAPSNNEPSENLNPEEISNYFNKTIPSVSPVSEVKEEIQEEAHEEEKEEAHEEMQEVVHEEIHEDVPEEKHEEAPSEDHQEPEETKESEKSDETENTDNSNDSNDSAPAEKKDISLPKDVINQVEGILNASIQKGQKEIDLIRTKIQNEEQAIEKQKNDLNEMRTNLENAKQNLAKEEMAMQEEIDKLNAIKSRVQDAIAELEKN